MAEGSIRLRTDAAQSSKLCSEGLQETIQRNDTYRGDPVSIGALVTELLTLLVCTGSRDERLLLIASLLLSAVQPPPQHQ